MEENYKNESMVDVAYSILKNEGWILSFTELVTVNLSVRFELI